MIGAVKASKQGDNETKVHAVNLFGNNVEKVLTMPLDTFLSKWERFTKGALIQEAFPELSPTEREFLLSGTTDEEWDEMFPEDEDEE